MSPVDRGHGFSDAGGGDEPGVEEVGDEFGVGAAGAAPRHGCRGGGGRFEEGEEESLDRRAWNDGGILLLVKCRTWEWLEEYRDEDD